MALLGADCGDDAVVRKLKVADLACGTGALLSAVYGRLSARARRGGLDDEELHPTFMEQVLVGADIMPAAVHVTASLLSAVHPSIPFGDTNVHLMPYGQVPGAGHSSAATAIGSLELIEDKEAASLFGTGRTAASGRSVHSANSKDALVLDHGSSDIVIMNPPFARTVGQEGDRVGIPRPAFAGFGTSEVEQKQMRDCQIFLCIRLREFLPANEAHRDEVRQQLDQAVLCDLLGLPESILGPLDTLREQWCREPTVHGGKRTRPDA